MSKTVAYTVIEIKEFLKLKPSGEFDPDETLRVLSKLAELISSSDDNNKILFDIRESYSAPNLTAYDVYLFVQELVKNRNAFHNKIAVLTRTDSQFDNGKFFELCAYNRGLDAKAFTDFEAVINWFSETKTAGIQNV